MNICFGCSAAYCKCDPLVKPHKNLIQPVRIWCQINSRDTNNLLHHLSLISFMEILANHLILF